MPTAILRSVVHLLYYPVQKEKHRSINARVHPMLIFQVLKIMILPNQMVQKYGRLQIIYIMQIKGKIKRPVWWK